MAKCPNCKAATNKLFHVGVDQETAETFCPACIDKRGAKPAVKKTKPARKTK